MKFREMCCYLTGEIFILNYGAIRKGKTARQNRQAEQTGNPLCKQLSVFDEITKKVKREGHMLPQEHRIAGG